MPVLEISRLVVRRPAAQKERRRERERERTGLAVCSCWLWLARRLRRIEVPAAAGLILYFPSSLLGPSCLLLVQRLFARQCYQPEALTSLCFPRHAIALCFFYREAGLSKEYFVRLAGNAPSSRSSGCVDGA